MKSAANNANDTQELIQIEDAPTAPSKRELRKRRITKWKTVRTFLRRGACSNTLMTVLDRSYGQPMDLEEQATDPLAGGMMQGYQCGMIWGSTLAAGAQAHRLFGPGPQAEVAALQAAQGIAGSFRHCHGSIDCIDITEVDPRNTWEVFKYHLLKGGAVTCGRRMARYAPVARQAIDEALSDERPRTSCKPASCAARMARMLGASEQHVTMAAGLAGGIGLSGGACGALGAAIWLLSMKGRQQGLSSKKIDAQIAELTERFQRTSDFEMECSEIVGRKFESIDDHAEHLSAGGCATILDTIAEAVEAVTAPAPAVDPPEHSDLEAAAG